MTCRFNVGQCIYSDCTFFVLCYVRQPLRVPRQGWLVKNVAKDQLLFECNDDAKNM